MIKNTWYFAYHHNPKQKWSLPRGFAEELENQKINLIRQEVSDPNMIKLPTSKEIETQKINVVLVFYAGYNKILNNNLIKHIVIFCPLLPFLNHFLHLDQLK